MQVVRFLGASAIANRNWTSAVKHAGFFLPEERGDAMENVIGAIFFLGYIACLLSFLPAAALVGLLAGGFCLVKRRNVQPFHWLDLVYPLSVSSIYVLMIHGPAPMASFFIPVFCGYGWGVLMFLRACLQFLFPAMSRRLAAIVTLALGIIFEIILCLTVKGQNI